MSWTKTVFAYCERGTDPSVFAEPVNALTNVAFFVAAGLAYRKLTKLPSAARDVDCLIFVVLIGLMGIGSSLFHLFGQRWAFIADVTPILIFVLVYLNYALVRFLDLTPGVSLLLTAALLGTAPLIALLPGGGLMMLNGSAGFVPVGMVLATVAWLAHSRGHPAGRNLMLGAGIFVASLLLRTIDRAICDFTNVGGHLTGTHGLWHVLNAFLLYLLVSTAIDHGRHGEKTYEVLPPTGHADEA